MKPGIETRFFRAFLSGILSSGLSDAELRQSAQELLTSEQFRLRMAMVLNAAVEAIAPPSVQIQPETTQTEPSRQPARWTMRLEAEFADKILSIAQKKHWSSARTREALREIGPPLWEPPRRGSVHDAIQDLQKHISPAQAFMLVDLLDQEQVPPDPYLTEILRKKREP